MSYFVVSMTYIIGGSLWLLIGNLTADQTSSRGTGSTSETIITALASPLGNATTETTEDASNIQSGLEIEEDQYTADRLTPTGVPEDSTQLNPEVVPKIQDLLFSRHELIRFESPAVYMLPTEASAAINALQVLCVEAFRETVDGRPFQIVVTQSSDLQALQQFERGIVSFVFSPDEWLSIRPDEEFQGDMWNHLYRIAHNHKQLAIVNTDTLITPPEHFVRKCRFEWRPLSPSQLREIYRLCCGYLPRIESQTQIKQSLDYERDPSQVSPGADDEPVYFEAYQERMQTAIESYAQSEAGVYRDATAEQTTSEETLHLALKQFTVRWLANKESVGRSPNSIAAQIRTDATVGNNQPDVKFRADIFEIETVSVENRTTDSVRNQFQRAFTKYGDADIQTVHIITDPLTMARYLDDILELAYNHVNWCEETGTSVRFHIPDLSSGELVPLRQFAEDMLAISDQISS